MDELKIFWTKAAVDQRNYVFEYWNRRNKSNSYSKRLNLAIRERILTLKSQPEMGISTELSGIKAIILEHYSIFYKIQTPALFIIGFWDNRQDPVKLHGFLKEQSRWK